ncbi:hypothetical protein LTR85_012107 [Meristemomyces frigidus]|nr:hypothetical protein LTR85_012107 [Meristemomyces frigidus]
MDRFYRSNLLLLMWRKFDHQWPSHLTRRSFAHILSDYRGYRCADPRDRIYGVLALIAWPAGTPAIEADYGKSTVQLASEALKHFDERTGLGFLRFTYNVLKALEIDSSHPDLVGDIAARRNAYSAEDKDFDIPWTPVQGAPAAQGGTWFQAPSWCSIWQSNKAFRNGNWRNSSLHRGMCSESWASSLCAPVILEQLTDDRQTPRALSCGSEHAAIACSAAQAGDVLLSLTLEGVRIALVLRAWYDLTYEIVGAAKLADGFDVCSVGRSCRCYIPYAHVSFDLYLSHKDMFMLLASVRSAEIATAGGDEFPSDCLSISVTGSWLSSFAVAQVTTLTKAMTHRMRRHWTLGRLKPQRVRKNTDV